MKTTPEYCNIPLERAEQTEAIDILHLKVGREMNKLLTFKRFFLSYVFRNMDNV